MFILFISCAFSSTTYTELESESSIFLQPYSNSNVTYVFDKSLTSIVKIDDYTYMFKANCYYYCTTSVIYFKIIYDSYLCDFSIYAMNKIQSGTNYNYNYFLTNVILNNFKNCPENKRPVKTFEEYLDYIKTKRYSIIDGYYFIVEFYVKNEQQQSNDLLTLQYMDNCFPNFVSYEQFQIIYNNHLYTLGIDDVYPVTGKRILHIGNAIDSFKESSDEVVPERKIYILYNDCKGSNESVIDVLLPNDQCYYGIYEGNFAIRPQSFKYTNGINTNELWYQIKNNIFEIVNDYTRVTNQDNYYQEPSVFDYLLYILNKDMKCKFFKGDQCRND